MTDKDEEKPMLRIALAACANCKHRIQGVTGADGSYDTYLHCRKRVGSHLNPLCVCDWHVPDLKH